MLHHAFGFLNDHFRNLDVTLRRFIKSGTDHLCLLTGSLHVRHLFRTFINQQDEKVDLWVVSKDGVGHILHEHCFPCSGGSYNQTSGPFANGANQIKHSRGIFTGVIFQNQALLWEEGRQIVEMNFVLRFFWILFVHCFHPQKGKEALFFLRGARLPRHNVPCLQIEATNLGG